MTCSITYPSCHKYFITSQLGTSRPTSPEVGPKMLLAWKFFWAPACTFWRSILTKPSGPISIAHSWHLDKKKGTRWNFKPRAWSVLCRTLPMARHPADPRLTAWPLETSGEAAMCRVSCVSHTFEDQMELWVTLLHRARVVTLPNWSCDWIFTHLNSMHGTPFSIFWKGC